MHLSSIGKKKRPIFHRRARGPCLSRVIVLLLLVAVGVMVGVWIQADQTTTTTIVEFATPSHTTANGTSFFLCSVLRAYCSTPSIARSHVVLSEHRFAGVAAGQHLTIDVQSVLCPERTTTGRSSVQFTIRNDRYYYGRGLTAHCSAGQTEAQVSVADFNGNSLSRALALHSKGTPAGPFRSVRRLASDKCVVGDPTIQTVLERDAVARCEGNVQLQALAGDDGTYTDPGAECIDRLGDVVSQVEFGGQTVDLTEVGQYTATYTCCDPVFTECCVTTSSTVTVVARDDFKDACATA